MTKAIQMGLTHLIDVPERDDCSLHTVKYALVLEFDDPETLRAAVMAGSVEFEFGL